MQTTHKRTNSLLALAALVILSVTALAADPGQAYPPQSEASDDKAGSLLIYNIYSSNAVSRSLEDTRINITNTSTGSPAFVHLFFVEGATCSVSDSYVCLTEAQTASFLTSDIDPGVAGYLIAVAVDGVTGCPRSFNFLIGDLLARFSTGHKVNLGAVAFSALYDGVLPGCNGNSATATIVFNGTTDYNVLPRALAFDNIPARASANDTLLILNRIGGDLASKADTLGSIFGILYDDASKASSFSFTAGSCQFRSSLTNSFPRTTPRIDQLIPAGRSGWMKLWLSSEAGLLGAMIIWNPNVDADADAFNGGHNLHRLTAATNAGNGLNTFTMPVFPPNCSSL